MNPKFKASAVAVSDTIGSDTIVINVKTGAYYSLTESGSEVWSAVQNEETTEQMIGFLLRFMEEGLIEVDASFDFESTSSAEESEVFEKYTDMESILLADPIHEVDDQGWPKLKG